MEDERHILNIVIFACFFIIDLVLTKNGYTGPAMNIASIIVAGVIIYHLAKLW